MPRVTVCLTDQGDAAACARTLRSASAQTYRDIELLLLGEERPRLPHHARTVSVDSEERGERLKRGVEEAQGELIALISPGDVWAPETVARLVESLDQTEAMLVHADGWRVEEGEEVPRDLHLSEDTPAFDHVLPNNLILPSAALFRREALLAAGNFCAGTEGCAEWYGWIVLAAGGRFVHLPERLVRARVSPVGYREHRAEYALLTRRVLPRRAELFESLHSAQATKYKRLLVDRSGVAMSAMASALKDEGNRLAALSLHRRALNLAPSHPRVWSQALRSLLS